MSLLSFEKEIKYFRQQQGENSRFSADIGFYIGVMDFAGYFIIMIVAAIATGDSFVNDARVQQMLYRFVMGSDEPEFNGGEK